MAVQAETMIGTYSQPIDVAEAPVAETISPKRVQREPLTHAQIDRLILRANTEDITHKVRKTVTSPFYAITQLPRELITFVCLFGSTGEKKQ